MSMRDAEEEGLVFQGGTANCWDSDEIEKLKQEAKEIRKLGFKAKAVKSNRGEWGCGSYVLMVEPSWFDYDHANRTKWMITELDKRIAEIRAEAEAEVAKITAEANEIKAVCDKYGIKY